MTLKGTVTAFYFENLYCQIPIDVTDDNGKVVNWGVGTYKRDPRTHKLRVGVGGNFPSVQISRQLPENS